MNINLGSAAKDKSRFDLSHDVVTTSNFGFFQPILCREIIPNTDIQLQTETFVRLANMVCPSFGQIKVKNSYAFVPFRLLYPNFTQLLQNQQVNGSNGSFVPTKVPSFNYVAMWLLSMLSAPGSFKCTLYDDAGTVVNTSFSLTSTNDVAGIFGNINTKKNVDNTIAINQHKYVFLLEQDVNSGKYHFFNYKQNVYVSSSNLENSQYFIGITPDTQMQTRINCVSKLMNGLGYRLPNFFGSDVKLVEDNVDYDSINQTVYDNIEVSILPILAFNRYYYEHLSPQRETTFQDSIAFRLIEIFRDRDGVNITDIRDSSEPIEKHTLAWTEYFRLLASLFGQITDYFYTLPPDIFTSALDSINNDNSEVSVITGDKNFEVVQASDGYSASAQPYGSGISAVMIQGILKMLKYSNRNTLVGRNVTNWLESRFGIVSQNEYTNTSHHLGMQNTDVQISDIYATANSEGDFGQTLGSYSGRGIGFESGKSIHFKAKEFGYLLCLQTVVPITGYYQGLPPDVQRLGRFDFFTSEFENIGYEALPMRNVQINQSDTGPTILSRTFGFIPRYGSYKYQHNLVNGDFANGYHDMEPYHLLRTLPKGVILSPTFRKLSQDLILGADSSYNRIFANTSPALDHFLIFNRLHLKLSAPMTPISRSYEVEDFGNGNFKVDYT